ncbi:MAG: phosphatase PAP2 family protein [Acidobacteria bacterium]|nr:phosphatase PAP2 family protein [Acidobacteriota bacterium]
MAHRIRRSAFRLLLLWAVTAQFPVLRGQNDAEQALNWRSFPRRIWQDQKGIWSSPFHATTRSGKWWGLFGSVTAGLVASDRWTSKQLPNTSGQIDVSSITSRFGAAYSVGPGVMALYLGGTLRGDARMREAGLIGAEAVADTFLVGETLKMVTWRERPLEGSGNGRFWRGATKWDSSFPSGHAMQAWAVASVIAHEYPRPRIIPVAAYSVASMVMVSRFTQRRHFAADVVAGAAAGWFIGNYVFHKRHRR